MNAFDFNPHGRAIVRTKTRKPQPPRNREELHQRALAILEFVEGFTAQHGHAPCIREIGDAVGLSSLSTVHSHLERLQDEGFLTWNPRRQRTLQVISTRSPMGDLFRTAILAAQEAARALRHPVR